MDEAALIYDECFERGGRTPDEVDNLSLLRIAMMLGRNRPPEREPWPADAPDIKVLRRLRARRENEGRLPRDFNPDAEISDAEYAVLLEEAHGGRRKEVTNA